MFVKNTSHLLWVSLNRLVTARKYFDAVLYSTCMSHSLEKVLLYSLNRLVTARKYFDVVLYSTCMSLSLEKVLLYSLTTCGMIPYGTLWFFV